MKQIEQCIKDLGLPVNSKAMLNRLSELLEEHNTNCLLSCRDDYRIKSVLWMLNSQIFGQLAKIDMEQLWHEINENL